MRKHSKPYWYMCRAAARARKARSEKNATEEFIQQRFWSKVDKRGQNECWPWFAGVAGRGYGAFRIGQRKINAHRFAWESVNGPIPSGLIACHHCDNVVCCNPAHIFIGTNKDNSDDCVSKKRLHPSKGTDHGMSKLDENKVIDARILYSSGQDTTYSIARKFGISQSQAWRIVRGKSWKHI